MGWCSENEAGLCQQNFDSYQKKISRIASFSIFLTQRGELESGLQRKSLFSNPIITIKTTHPIWLLTAVCFLTFDWFHGWSRGLSSSTPYPSFKNFNQFFPRIKVHVVKLRVLLTPNSAGWKSNATSYSRRLWLIREKKRSPGSIHHNA